MNPLLNTLLLTLALGAGATLVMDAWLLLLQRLGIATLNFAFVGRWVGHLLRGRIRHSAIGQSEPIRGELGLGWLMHYATGIAFAALLLGLTGMAWIERPTLWPALALGVCTVAIPLLLVQPAMGAGIASRNTPTPLKNSLKSLATHSVFGLGLYLSASLLVALGV
ncbi:DUF2938 domain-containing protein [Pseudomonas xionganensis]|uniref:DUF2938 family protein n=1 Tax=Pseudomonas xionganensis TaxID=2654845 RepID=A0A6I4L1M7_9PSED|nr:DUF2938 domain-containing protein [Pseudomonas xionganensis]MVW75913.1 DUF2938 family protein [Pseudomonas xionganensis]